MTVISPQKRSILIRIPLLFHPNDRNKTPKCLLLTWKPLLFHPNDHTKTPKCLISTWRPLLFHLSIGIFVIFRNNLNRFWGFFFL
jgi:hypothetical protein